MFVGLAMLMPPITGESSPVGVASTDDSQPRASFMRLAHSVSFANTPAFRESMAPREGEPEPKRGSVRRASQMYDGSAGAGLVLPHGSFTSPRGSFAMSLPTGRSGRGSVFQPRRSSLQATPSPHEKPSRAEGSLVHIQMPSLGEVSERSYSRRITNFSPTSAPLPPPESIPFPSHSPSI